MTNNNQVLFAHRMGIDTYKQPIVFLSNKSSVCKSEGFESLARVSVMLKNRVVIATLNMVYSDLILPNQVGLSEFAWKILGANEGDTIRIFHPDPLESLSFVRAKIYGHKLGATQMHSIVNDISKGMYSDIHLSSFITACAGGNMDEFEVLELTRSMINVGDKLTWPAAQIFDKHCVGGLPGNRTTILVVPIVAEFGLTIPKTSSRAITSPAGTADTMEVMAPVNLTLKKIREVIAKENGCIVWGGSTSLSPADDILIRVERALNLDNEGQLVASVLSKKVSAGSTHVIIDLPIGPTAKVRGLHAAEHLRKQFETVAKAIGINIEVVFTDGTKPIGRGIGPALEAKDVLAVLQNKPDAPEDLRERSLYLAGKVLEFSAKVKSGEGIKVAEEILASGRAWKKFQAICEAQGGFTEPRLAEYQHTVTATSGGVITTIDNRRLATIAKLAGAPHAKGAGILLHKNVGASLEKNEPLFTIYSETPGELAYAVKSIRSDQDIMKIKSEII